MLFLVMLLMHSPMKKNLLLIAFIFLASVCKIQAADTLDCETLGYPSSGNAFNEVGYTLNHSVGEYNGCQFASAMMIAIIDSATCLPLNTSNNNFGQANLIGSCRNRAENYFIFRFNDTASVNSMIHLLDSVGNGNYILAYTWFTYPYSTMTNFAAFKNAFVNLGATGIATIPDTVPYIFFCKKGTPSSVHELRGVRTDDTLHLRVAFQCAVTDVHELSEQPSFAVFPDPSTGIFYFQKNGSREEVSSIEVTDAIGRIIYSVNESVYKINISFAANGVYFYKIKRLTINFSMESL